MEEFEIFRLSKPESKFQIEVEPFKFRSTSLEFIRGSKFKLEQPAFAKLLLLLLFCCLCELMFIEVTSKRNVLEQLKEDDKKNNKVAPHLKC